MKQEEATARIKAMLRAMDLLVTLSESTTERYRAAQTIIKNIVTAYLETPDAKKGTDKALFAAAWLLEVPLSLDSIASIRGLALEEIRKTMEEK